VGFFDFVGDIARIAAPVLTFLNPPLGIAAASIGGVLSPQGPAPAAPVGAPTFLPMVPDVPGFQLPSIQQLTGAPSFFADPVVQGEGAVMPAMAGGAVIMGLTRSLALTISKLAARLGISVLGLAGLGRVGSRIWRSLTVFARRHPSISLISMLTALGLTIEEASEYIAWGSTRRRRRRGGISGRDMRVAKRTIRRISSFQHDLAHLRAHATGTGFRRRSVGRGVQVVRAG
jgi:hypothetical protein